MSSSYEGGHPGVSDDDRGDMGARSTFAETNLHIRQGVQFSA